MFLICPYLKGGGYWWERTQYHATLRNSRNQASGSGHICHRSTRPCKQRIKSTLAPVAESPFPGYRRASFAAESVEMEGSIYLSIYLSIYIYAYIWMIYGKIYGLKIKPRLFKDVQRIRVDQYLGFWSSRSKVPPEKSRYMQVCQYHLVKQSWDLPKLFHSCAFEGGKKWEGFGCSIFGTQTAWYCHSWLCELVLKCLFETRCFVGHDCWSNLGDCWQKSCFLVQLILALDVS